MKAWYPLFLIFLSALFAMAPVSHGNAFTILKTAVTPALDGDLLEYAGADSISLTPSTGGNTATVRAVWDDEALYLAYEIIDSNINASVTVRDNGVSSEDSVGWAIDTLNDDGGSEDPNSVYMLPDDYRGTVNILNTQADSRGTVSGSSSSSWNGSWQSLVQLNGTNNNDTDTDTGYTVEVKIPWTDIGYATAPAGDTAVRIGFFLYDKDGYSIAQAKWPEGGGTAFGNASNWQEVIISSGIAGKRFVSATGSDSDDCSRPLSPCASIQYALDRSRDGDAIKVAVGTYNENIQIVCCSSSKNLGIQGGWSGDFSGRDEKPSNTVIDGGGRGSVISINTDAINLTIEGVTIRNGFNSAAGGGIFVFPFYHGNITLTLINNIIAHNKSGSYGGGVYVLSKEYATSTLILSDNLVINNSAVDYCGGVCVSSEDSANTVLNFTNNTIIDNSSGSHGGGIYIRAYSGAVITSFFSNNAIAGNAAAYFGGGIYAYSESDATLIIDFTDNKITGNWADYFGGGIYAHSVSGATLITNFIKNSIAGNSSAMHGGGVYELSAFEATTSSSFTSNIITGNAAVYDGGGIFSLGTTMSSFADNIVAGNSADRGGGIFTAQGPAFTVTNSTITGNSSTYLGGGIYVFNNTMDIINTIIRGNDSTDIDASGDGIVNLSHSVIGNGPFNDDGTNMNADPQFVNAPSGDYHLTASSPVINSGDNSAAASISTDYEGDIRIMYGIVDIGADEHVFNFVKTEILPAIDGDLSEYAGADRITLTSSTGGNTAIVRAVWNDEALYLAYEVTDANLNASVTVRDGGLSNEDSVGWAIDTLNDYNGSGGPNSVYMLPDDYLGTINILNTQYDGRGTATGAPSSLWNGSWQSAVRINGTNNNNTDTDSGYTVEVKIPWTTLGFAGAPAGEAAVRIGFLLNDKDASVCDVNPNGTYIDAENFTGTISQGTGTFSIASSQTGYIGSGYLRSNGGGGGPCPPAHQGKQYQVDFPTTGTYNFWVKGFGGDGNSDSLFIGFDGACVGALTEDGTGRWYWTKTIHSGSNTFTVSVPGPHTINIWVREANHLADGIYLTKGAETPSDASHGIEIDPTACGPSNSTMWPQGGGTEFQNASNWQEMVPSVLTRYYCDDDHDGHIDSSLDGICFRPDCKPAGCLTTSGDDCDDNDFYEHPDQSWYKDSDNDDYSDGAIDQTSCVRPPGYKTVWELTATSGDCDETNASVNPGVPEIWYDGADQNCDGWNDYDQDKDTYVHENWNAGAGGTSTGTDDCNDVIFTVNPKTYWYQDSDGDSYGNPLVFLRQCMQPAGYVLYKNDCNDDISAINPNTYWYQDSDGDGYGNTLGFLQQCTQPPGYVPNNNDCDDTDSGIIQNAYYPDYDRDGYGNPAIFILDCYQPAGYVPDNTDCDDNDADIYPGGPPVRISGGSPFYYYLLQEAYDAASDGNTIQSQDAIFNEAININRNIAITLQGGYDCSYSDITGITTINGVMPVTDGSVVIENFEIQ